ncbi:branched-chain-amino-acid aminotransferase [Verticillium alfalfae VaMs.102]|uniref:Branched-chain-amino-acid aminotransferase n=1 Tax=Verticillium alfalfae (strain VaMs.102 / ATCC MYA-4576 / FGSC 10136) TaxID=526221 RepID=C9SA59_VERA1|nr:branched-chain-amino-acid aminotransferase [Verticillium alfalfae VaMs.102]EEY16272.1 branched-chain-amino-acid aminotransferase [Verticillium alfalfae VaMs.102]
MRERALWAPEAWRARRRPERSNQGMFPSAVVPSTICLVPRSPTSALPQNFFDGTEWRGDSNDSNDSEAGTSLPFNRLPSPDIQTPPSTPQSASPEHPLKMAAFPPPPTDTIDWANVGFQVREVNGHIESTYSKSTGQWTPLKFVASPFMRIHGMAPALNYGQQAYEGLKAFRGPGDNTIALFRPDRNALRLQHSADVASMPRVPEQIFLDACRAAVALNAAFVPPHATGAAMYVRPQIYGSSAQLGLSPPDEYTFAVFVIPTGVYHGVHPVKPLILDEFDRAAPHGTGHAKVGGNYAPVLRWSDKGPRRGYGITLHLDSARHEESTSSARAASSAPRRGRRRRRLHPRRPRLAVRHRLGHERQHPAHCAVPGLGRREARSTQGWAAARIHQSLVP